VDVSATLALVAGLVWLIVANLIGMLPSRDRHWTSAYVLMAFGLPILIWIAIAKGPIWAALFLGAGASVLRWPLVYVWRWVKSRFGVL
jgi:hypothetical protein